MKNKGAMTALIAVLAIGLLITKSTYRFIEKLKSASGMETQLAEDEALWAGEAAVTVLEGEIPDLETSAVLEADTGFLKEQEVDGKAADSLSCLADNGCPDEDMAVLGGGGSPDRDDSGSMGLGRAEEEKKKLAEAKIYAEEPISPLDTAPAQKAESLNIQADSKKEAVLVETQSYYKKRLMDLDIQIQRSRESQEGDGLNSSARSSASDELKLWDSELNAIYNAILETLDQEHSELLAVQQRAWMKERDSLAMEAAKNSSGSLGESGEYTASFTESTRLRAYELVEKYAAELEK